MGCNSLNHALNCHCGFGGNTSTSNVNSAPVNSSEYFYKEDLKHAKTYWSRCWLCGEEVFFHTNGYGDFVLFDNLGHPWPIHICWVNHWKDEKARRKAVEDSAEFQKYFDNSKPAEAIKYQSLANAVRGLAGVYSGTIFIGITEEKVANKMKISVQKLRRVYRGFYSLTQSGGIQIFLP